jgi:hypothetical protein
VKRRDFGKVAVGFCYNQTTQTPQWTRSYRFVLLRSAHRIVGEFARETSGVHLPRGRCEIVRDFLTHPQRPDWLWMMDTDATFPDDILERLIASADPLKRPIMGALAFGVRPLMDDDRPVINACGAGPLELFPTIFIYDENGTNRIDNYPRDQVVHCHATGAHCLLIHRNVLADERWTKDGHPQPWFRSSIWNGQEVSEDHFFCIKAGSFGYPIHVDTAAKTGHVKTFVADEDLYLAQRSSLIEDVA